MVRRFSKSYEEIDANEILCTEPIDSHHIANIIRLEMLTYDSLNRTNLPSLYWVLIMD